MDLPTTPKLSGKPLGSNQGFSIRFFLGAIFVLFGILVLLELFKIKFLSDHVLIVNTLKYGTALGSFIGGFFMIFKKKNI